MDAIFWYICVALGVIIISFMSMTIIDLIEPQHMEENYNDFLS